MPPALFYFLKIALAILFFLIVPYTFLGYSSSLKKYHVLILGITLNL